MKKPTMLICTVLLAAVVVSAALLSSRPASNSIGRISEIVPATISPASGTPAVMPIDTVVSTPQRTVLEMQTKSFDPNNPFDYKAYFKDHKVLDETKKLDDIPVYRGCDLLLHNHGCLHLGTDEGTYLGFYGVGSSSLADSLFTTFPNTAIRQRKDGTLYAVYDTDDGARVFVFFLQSLEYRFTAGTLLLVGEVLPYEKYSKLKVGDSIQKVVEIDPYTEYYQKYMYNSEVHVIRTYIEDGAGPASIHLLTNGVLKITYDIDDDRNLTIASMDYQSDYTIQGLAGVTVNYNINPLDLP